MEKFYQNVCYEHNIIEIKRIDHPKCVSDFIKCIKDRIKRGYMEIIIKISSKNCYPNACVPISGIIQYYKKQGIDFSFNFDQSSYLSKCCFNNPYSFTDEEDLDSAYAFPLDKVFRFNSSLQIAKLSQAYVDALSSLCECESGVLDSISWCINEVMDNVLTHSESSEGYVMAQLHQKTSHIAFCVYDSGIGIFDTLKRSKHHPREEIDALTLAIQEGVGDGKGQGNGLFGLYESVLRNSGILSLTSGGSSIMLTDTGTINKFKKVPFLDRSAKQTIVDFQINLNKKIDFKTIFSSISNNYEPFDSRIDDMLSETDELLHYDVFENSKGTGTRDAGRLLRNDVINILKREKRVMILDFLRVRAVSSSFIDEFIAKLLLKMGFIRFNKRIRVSQMNENVAFLCERSVYMRITEAWNNREIKTEKEE